MTLQLTNAGLNALLRAMSGDRIVFTTVKIGNAAAQDVASATDLANPLKTLDITSVSVNGNNATLETSFNNADIEAGFRLLEVGIFAQNQDDADSDILYAYGTEAEETADYIAANSDSILETKMEFSIFVGNAENISAIINESLAYATRTEFEAHLNDKNNPHGVTKAQVGLGNVPNVSTNGQTPTYREPTEITNLTSGETLSVAFGKIKKAVAGLIAHLANKSNPHAVTASQVGAAKNSHTHAAADITKGVLGVARGGTGKSAWGLNRLVYAEKINALGQIEQSAYKGGILRQNTVGAPFWEKPVISGEYTGFGKCGESYPNSITFSDGRIPHIIVIACANNSVVTLGLLFPHIAKGFSVADTDGTGSPCYRLNLSLSGNTVSWYSLGTPARQCNNINHIYIWHGLCR